MSSGAPLAVVAGSGIDLRGLLDSVETERPFVEIAGLPESSVAGHAGSFVHGARAAQPIVLQRGRLHLYEGHAYETVVGPIDALHALGVRTVILTNAVGGLLPEMEPGDLVAVEHLHPLPCWHWPNQPQEMTTDFILPKCDHAGTYMWFHGPSYETRAEVAALQQMGGSIVGMSAGPELMRCQELGMRAAVVSCVTNNCCTGQALSHDDVLAATAQASARLVACIENALDHMIQTI